MKNLILGGLALCIASGVHAQSVSSAYSISRHDLRGTARFMSMGGAFGALGADLSCLAQNPGGIGVYRSNEVGLTLGASGWKSNTSSGDFKSHDSYSKFNFNNAGAVFTFKLSSDACPNINFGFTFNKVAEFNRRYTGEIPNLRTSFTNYVAGVANANGIVESDLIPTSSYDPYQPPYGSPAAPWITIMGYDAYMINPEGNQENPVWRGQFGNGTQGRGYFSGQEKGYVDSYNLAFGGNIANTVFWGMDFDITALDYRLQSSYGEALKDAYVYDPNSGQVEKSWADWDIYDTYRMHGTGFNFKLGVIVKPIQELRIGFAFHTPTFYNLKETYSDNAIRFDYPFITEQEIAQNKNYTYANDGYPAGEDYHFRTPWRVLTSVAGVIGTKFIVSADYEWAGYTGMRYSKADGYIYYDPWYDWDDPWSDWEYRNGKQRTRVIPGSPRQQYARPEDYANSKIKKVFKDTHTVRIGGEYRVLSCLSLRVGYSYSSSPSSKKANNELIDVPGTGLASSYTLDNGTYHITAGVGYKYKGFYIDLAYVYRHQNATYFPFSPDTENPGINPKAKLNFSTNTAALSIGYKF